MNRNDQVRAVYVELRAKLGPDFTAKDIIQFAQLVVDSYYRREREDPGQRTPSIGPLAFMHQPVDEVMADGGWSVLEFERRRGMAFDDDDPIEERLGRMRRRRTG